MHEENLNKQKKSFRLNLATCCWAKLFLLLIFPLLYSSFSERERAKAEINKIWKSHYAMFMHNLTCHSQEMERTKQKQWCVCIWSIETCRGEGNKHSHIFITERMICHILKKKCNRKKNVFLVIMAVKRSIVNCVTLKWESLDLFLPCQDILSLFPYKILSNHP